MPAVTGYPTRTEHQLEEPLFPQMDTYIRRRPSTAPHFGPPASHFGPTASHFGPPASAMPFSSGLIQWAPSFSSGSLNGYAAGRTTPGTWQNCSGPVTPGVFATACDFPILPRNDLSRYSLSTSSNSAPGSPGERDGAVGDGKESLN